MFVVAMEGELLKLLARREIDTAQSDTTIPAFAPIISLNVSARLVNEKGLLMEKSPEEIVEFLKANGRSTVKQIGTDNPTIYALEAKGVVQRDGIIPQGGRGRPPVAWIVA